MARLVRDLPWRGVPTSSQEDGHTKSQVLHTPGVATKRLVGVYSGKGTCLLARFETPPGVKVSVRWGKVLPSNSPGLSGNQG